MRLECEKRAQKNYRAKGKQFHFFLTNEKDQDVIEWLADQESASAAIKALIRADIASKKTVT